MALKRCRSLEVVSVNTGDDAVGVASLGADDSLINGPFSQPKKRGRKANKGNLAPSQPLTTANGSEENNCSIDISAKEKCVFCHSECDNTTCIQCDDCEQFYHLKCCGVKDTDFTVAISITSLLGWTCRACRADTVKELKKLRSEFTELKARCKTAPGEVFHHTINSANESRQVTSNIPTGATKNRPQISCDDQKVTYSAMVKLVSRTVIDTNSRKRNVIVSGLPEDGCDDEKMFSDLCQDHFAIKPSLRLNGTQRVGNAVPRRMIVRLESEIAAFELIRCAKNLRKSEDSYTHRMSILTGI